MKKLAIVLPILFSEAPMAQDYFHFPMSVGDRWQLYQTVQVSPPIVDHWDFEVTSDTLMPNGHTYSVFGSSGYRRQSSNQVLLYSPADSQEYVEYDFGKSVGDTVGYHVSGNFIFDVIFQDADTGMIFGEMRRFYTFFHVARNAIDVDHVWTLLDSIGFYQFGGFVGTYNFNGAVISGKTYGGIVSVPASEPIQAQQFLLNQNYPNPFNSQTEISFALQTMTHVRLSVHSLLGQTIQILVDKLVAPGEHSIIFDAKSLSSGVYIYRLSTEKSSSSKIMILNK